MDERIKSINSKFANSDLDRVKQYRLEVTQVDDDWYHLNLVDTDNREKLLWEGNRGEIVTYLWAFKDSIWIMNGGY